MVRAGAVDSDVAEAVREGRRAVAIAGSRGGPGPRRRPRRLRPRALSGGRARGRMGSGAAGGRAPGCRAPRPRPRVRQVDAGARGGGARTDGDGTPPRRPRAGRSSARSAAAGSWLGANASAAIGLAHAYDGRSRRGRAGARVRRALLPRRGDDRPSGVAAASCSPGSAVAAAGSATAEATLRVGARGDPRSRGWRARSVRSPPMSPASSAEAQGRAAPSASCWTRRARPSSPSSASSTPTCRFGRSVRSCSSPPNTVRTHKRVDLSQTERELARGCGRARGRARLGRRSGSPR